MICLRKTRGEMKRHSYRFGMIISILLLIATAELASGQGLPVMEGNKVVATINGEPLTLDEFNRELTSLHQGRVGDKKPGRQDRLELLRRLINTRLIVQEAKRIGLDELREIQMMVDAFSKVTLREELMKRQVKDIKVDDKEVENFYKESVKEWKVSSLMFEKEEVAKKMVEEVKAGKNFDDLSKQFIAEGAAKRGEEGQYVKVKEINPQIAKVASQMEVGSVSPVIPIKLGFVVLRLEDVRYPEDPEALNQARQEALKQKKVEVLKSYNAALIKKYVKMHQKVLDRIDYESEAPGFEALLKDKRVVAEIKGENPITVGELTQHVKQQLYHGVQSAVEAKRLNSRKAPAFEEMLYKRVFRKEALRLGLDKTESYKNKVKEYENFLLFGAFVRKAIVPDIKLKEEEIKSYYNEHKGEYTFPEMVKMNSLVFAKRQDAEIAIEKLRKGTELQWLSANTEGQVDRNTPGILTFDGKLLSTKDLPEGLRKVISGVRAGDTRLYASPEGYFYVLFVQEVLSSRPQSYEEVREIVSRKLFDDKVRNAIEDYADKLRAASDVKIYLKD
jgi:parvulin-like peptidyl-prolyl isomerase